MVWIPRKDVDLKFHSDEHITWKWKPPFVKESRLPRDHAIHFHVSESECRPFEGNWGGKGHPLKSKRWTVRFHRSFSQIDRNNSGGSATEKKESDVKGGAETGTPGSPNDFDLTLEGGGLLCRAGGEHRST